MSYSDVSEASLGVVKAIFWPLMLFTITVTGDCVMGSMLRISSSRFGDVSL